MLSMEHEFVKSVKATLVRNQWPKNDLRGGEQTEEVAVRRQLS